MGMFRPIDAKVFIRSALPSPSVSSKILIDVAPPMVFLCRIGIFDRSADPQASSSIKRHVHRLLNIRLCCKELYLKTRG